MLQPVCFSEALVRLCCFPELARRKRLDGSRHDYRAVQILLEIGPHAALKGPIQDTLKEHPVANTITYYSAMKRHASADSMLLEVLGYMFCHGIRLDLQTAYSLGLGPGHASNRRKVLTDLPEYPFDHTRTYWPNGRLGKEFRFRRHKRLDLLGKPVLDWNPLDARWKNFLKLSELPWAEHHKVSICF